jgi:hypothetical protein
MRLVPEAVAAAVEGVVEPALQRGKAVAVLDEWRRRRDAVVGDEGGHPGGGGGGAAGTVRQGKGRGAVLAGLWLSVFLIFGGSAAAGGGRGGQGEVLVAMGLKDLG